jgi:hypothetical protein
MQTNAPGITWDIFPAKALLTPSPTTTTAWRGGDDVNDRPVGNREGVMSTAASFPSVRNQGLSI